MKIHRFSFLPLCVAAVFPVYAFKSTVQVQQATGNLRLHEDQLLSNFYSTMHQDMQNLPFGTCGVTPVPGCQCAWCTSIRNVKP